ncbi:hypothetical protein COCSADRAFT_29108 [Bipolaris sorokiniana ND90Pr]|uniref:Uncharacterized protein n=1 Tax=Cochliobolus sativus (strain ND90Pr / ATCC 201652) TaxID=665912 RepID=M2SVE7_COCSN|nr:uncharacterized protein COCSADRAFT_29108 [Bipolaris sorokiniana ND90Pr]EMD60792.1 hypothetical protein COCSADRAFT_29108 [Bipolaris sorokiniana ND90Pr]
MTDSMGLTETRQTEILLVAWVMTGAVIYRSLSIFFPVKLVHDIGWDDHFILLSLIFSIIASSFVPYGVVLGFGQHTAVVVAQFGNERLSKGAMIQMLGYPFNIETMREVIARLVLEYKYSQQLFVLVLRVHDVHGRGIGSGAGMQILGSADGLEACAAGDMGLPHMEVWFFDKARGSIQVSSSRSIHIYKKNKKPTQVPI